MNPACFFRRSSVYVRRNGSASPGAPHGSWGRRCEAPPPPSSPSPWTRDREQRSSSPVGGANVMHLERHRRLAAQQAPPPATLQALVQRLVHRHHPLHARAVGAVGLHTQAHVSPPVARPPRAPRHSDVPQSRARRAPPPAAPHASRSGRAGRACGSAARAVAAPRSAAPMPPCSSHSQRRRPHDQGSHAEQSPEQQPREHLPPLLRPHAHGGTTLDRSTLDLDGRESEARCLGGATAGAWLAPPDRRGR